MDYRMLYEKLVAEAEENGLGGEFVDWGISISKWRADPVALALYGWLLENEPEGMAAKSERQIDWEMGIVGMASSRRREEAVKSWRRSPGAAERENGGFLVALGLSNAAFPASFELLPQTAYGHSNMTRPLAAGGFFVALVWRSACRTRSAARRTRP